MYYILYPYSGRTRSYTFSIDACTPPRAMLKRDLAQAYHPEEPKGELARKALHYELLHARQPVGTLSDDDRALARGDGNVYLSDVLSDICPWVSSSCPPMWLPSSTFSARCLTKKITLLLQRNRRERGLSLPSETDKK